MKKQSGFTLIEVVIVIVILGILAVTAASKMIDLREESKFSTLQGLSGSMQSALSMVYAQALLENIQSEEMAHIVWDDAPIMLTYGYPIPDNNYMSIIVEGLDNWKLNPQQSGDAIVEAAQGKLIYGYDDYACAVVYNAAGENQLARVTMEGEGCP